jgi:hypothetical protein
MFSIKLGEGGYVICYEMEDIEKTLGFGRNSLVSCNEFVLPEFQLMGSLLNKCFDCL